MISGAAVSLFTPKLLSLSQAFRNQFLFDCGGEPHRRMEPLPRPDGGNQNRGPKLLAVFWTQLSTCMIVVAMRMYSRYKLKTTGVDDWFMVVTLVRWLLDLFQHPQ